MTMIEEEGALIELASIAKVFATEELDTHALAGVHLTIRKGEYVAIEGPCGSGKTTLLSILGLLDVPSSGSYRLRGDLRSGLGVISRRAEALGRFMSSYASMARLPPPRPGPVHLEPFIVRVAALETRVRVEVEGGPDVTVDADADQLEQVLINLLKNAAEASLGAGKAGVRVRWATEPAALRIEVEDEGSGVDATANLFVPFFTTKQGGSGIGLALSRQIIEAHDGQLSLASRTDGAGALATVRLPVSSSR